MMTATKLTRCSHLQYQPTESASGSNLLFHWSFLQNSNIPFHYPRTWQLEAAATNIGMGRGRIKSRRVPLIHDDQFQKYLNRPDLFEKYLFMTVDEFLFIIAGLEDHRRRIDETTSLTMSFPNKVLLTMLFIIQYKGNKHLAYQFNVSEYYVSKVLDEILPCLTEFFAQFIPNTRLDDQHLRSRLHPQIRCIIDNTLHKTRKPRVNQAFQYNGHYHTHGRTSQLLVSFDGYILAFFTLLPGKAHDSLAAMYNGLFKRLLGNEYFALGDSGYQAVSYVIAGYKPCQLNTQAKRVFDRIARNEQVIIEHINGHFKTYRSVNKLDCFYHGDHRLLACIFVAIGSYNLKRSWGYYTGPVLDGLYDE